MTEKKSVFWLKSGGLSLMEKEYLYIKEFDDYGFNF